MNHEAKKTFAYNFFVCYMASNRMWFSFFSNLVRSIPPCDKSDKLDCIRDDSELFPIYTMVYQHAESLCFFKKDLVSFSLPIDLLALEAKERNERLIAKPDLLLKSIPIVWSLLFSHPIDTNQWALRKISLLPLMISSISASDPLSISTPQRPKSTRFTYVLSAALMS